MLLTSLACGKSGEATDTTTAATTTAVTTAAVGDATSAGADADPVDPTTQDDLPAEMDHVISCGYHGMEAEYGVLPYPKYEEDQAEYRTLARTTHNSFMMPITCKDPAMAGAVLEALGSSNYRTVIPTYFDVAMKVKYSHNTTASKIFDLIHDSMALEFGNVYNRSLSSAPINTFTGVFDNINTFASGIKAQSSMIAKMYAKLVSTIEEKCEE